MFHCHEERLMKLCTTFIFNHKTFFCPFIKNFNL
nr:MAG TPA: hypothetical protein [Caudoviricetes sp.]